MDVKFNISKFTGKLCVAFSSKATPLVLASMSSIPDVALDIDYGETSMGRLSNLALLVLKSLVNSHLVYPNAVPVLICEDSKEHRRPFVFPASLFNSSYLKILSVTLCLPPVVIAEYPFVACHFMFNGQKTRVETSPTSVDVNWNFTYSFSLASPLVPAEALPLYVRVMVKKKKSSQSVALEELEIPVDLKALGVRQMLRHPLTQFGGMVTIEAFCMTPDLCKALMPLEKQEADGAHSQKYLNGMSWSNLKTALQTLAATPKDFNSALSSANTDLAADIPVIHVDSVDSPTDSVLERLRFYEHQIVHILKFLADHNGELEEPEGTVDHIQTSLEAFRADLSRMIEDYPNNAHSVGEMGSIIQSFIGLVTQKIAKVDPNDQAKEMLQPIESHLKTLLPSENLSTGHFSDGGFDLAPDELAEFMSTPTKKGLFIHDSLAASAPNLNESYLDCVELVSTAEFFCFMGQRPVSMILGEQSILIEDLQSHPTGKGVQSFAVTSLADSYGTMFSQEAIETHQFAKKWNLTIDEERISIAAISQPACFPYYCINTNRLLKVKVFDASRERASDFKASFIELYYLQDEEQTVVEYLKFFACASDCSRIFQLLQHVFLVQAGTCEIPWSSVERVEVSTTTIMILFNPPFENSGPLEAVKLSSFFGVHDIHDAYCELQSRMHKRSRSFSPLSGSVSPAHSSTSSLTVGHESMRREPSSYQLFRPNLVLFGKACDQSVLSSFGILCAPDLVEGYFCSYMRRGLNVGKLYITPQYLCFSGRRNGIRSSRMVVKWSAVENAEVEVRWFSKGFSLKFEESDEAYFFFGFRRDGLTDCLVRILSLIEREQARQEE